MQKREIKARAAIAAVKALSAGNTTTIADMRPSFAANHLTIFPDHVTYAGYLVTGIRMSMGDNIFPSRHLYEIISVNGLKLGTIALTDEQRSAAISALLPSGTKLRATCTIPYVMGQDKRTDKIRKHEIVTVDRATWSRQRGDTVTLQEHADRYGPYELCDFDIVKP